jgi:hypothetical protein
MSRKLRSFLSSFEARRRGSRLAIFVVLASIFHALATPWLGSKFPKFFKNGYEPLFCGASLSFAEKDRAVADAAGDFAATGDDGADAVAAGGGRGECGMISPRHSGAREARARNPQPRSGVCIPDSRSRGFRNDETCASHAARRWAAF